MAMARAMVPALLLTGAAGAQQSVVPSPDLGKAEARCRPDERGPAVIVTAVGLKDRKGLMRAELYPDNDDDFLEDDAILVRAGKVFRRAEMEMPQSGPVQLCLRLPGPGSYTLSLLHDRDGNRKFGLSSDGVGFPNNPRLGLGKPDADKAHFSAGPGLTFVSIRLNYRRGLFSFGPLKNADD
jgi:uncharacterized protein (DUF2141 family)